MKNKIFGIIRKAALPAILAGSMLAFSPVGAMAAEGHGGRGGAHSFAGGERGFRGGERGGYVDHDYRRGGDWHGYRGYGGGVYVAPYAYGPSYGYAAPAPDPCGYYDQFGYWHADPNCYVPY